MVGLAVTDDLLRNNHAYAQSFATAALASAPAKKLAVLTCMDARLNIEAMLGLHEGDAHVIRNAGGIVADDAIRSLIISQRLLGTQEVVLIQHTDCGMMTFREDELKKQIEDETGDRLPFALGAFSDLDENVRQSITTLKSVRSSRTRRTCAASSMTSRRGSCARWRRTSTEFPNVLGSEVVRDDGERGG